MYYIHVYFVVFVVRLWHRLEMYCFILFAQPTLLSRRRFFLFWRY